MERFWAGSPLKKHQLVIFFRFLAEAADVIFHFGHLAVSQ